jgi:hypothetical protein
MSYTKSNPNSQATMANSAPVVIASDQSAVPVSGTVTANTGLTQPLTDTQLRATPVPVSGTFYQATQPVSATDLDIRNLAKAQDEVYAVLKTDAGVAYDARLVTVQNATLAVTQSGTWDEVGINDSGNSITVDNGGTFAVQATLAAETTKVIGTVNQGTSPWVTSNATTSVVGNGAAATAQRVTLANDSTGIVALTTSTASIGKLAANSGVDIGDVDVLSIAAGTNAIGNVGVIPRTTGGATPYKLVSAATTNATTIKASAGQVFMVTASNVNAAVRYLKFYNKASAPTVGTDTPVLTFAIPGNTAGAGTNIPIPACGIAFGTGISFATTTEATDAGTTGVAANEIVINIAYA